MRQATIQGALGGLPLDLVNAHMSGLPRAEYAAYQNWASDILNTGVLAIVICAPLGLLIIGAQGRKGCTCVICADGAAAHPGHLHMDVRLSADQRPALLHALERPDACGRMFSWLERKQACSGLPASQHARRQALANQHVLSL